jgi:guanosine-3',5'-bis(diphosphate) 3'-pyrophosphohydrolase
VVHNAHCSVAKRLQHKDSERFIAVDWADEPTRLFETGVVVTVTNGKGVLARVAQNWPTPKRTSPMWTWTTR